MGNPPISTRAMSRISKPRLRRMPPPNSSASGASMLVCKEQSHGPRSLTSSRAPSTISKLSLKARTCLMICQAGGASYAGPSRNHWSTRLALIPYSRGFLNRINAHCSRVGLRHTLYVSREVISIFTLSLSLSDLQTRGQRFECQLLPLCS